MLRYNCPFDGVHRCSARFHHSRQLGCRLSEATPAPNGVFVAGWLAGSSSQPSFWRHTGRLRLAIVGPTSSPTPVDAPNNWVVQRSHTRPLRLMLRTVHVAVCHMYRLRARKGIVATVRRSRSLRRRCHLSVRRRTIYCSRSRLRLISGARDTRASLLNQPVRGLASIANSSTRRIRYTSSHHPARRPMGASYFRTYRFRHRVDCAT